MPSSVAPGNTGLPLDHARAALRLLVTRRIVPTPEAYRIAYEEVSGISEQASVQSMLAGFAASCQKVNPALAAIGAHIGSAVASSDWQQCGQHFAALQAYLRQHAVPDLHAGERGVFKTFPTSAEQQAELLRNLYGRTLGIALVSLLQHAPVLARQADALGQLIRDATSHATLDDATAQLRQLCFEIELLRGDSAEQQELLLRLFRLLLDNIGELIDDDVWMREQIGVVRALLSGTISHRVLDDAARKLKEIIYKQGVLKQGIAEARSAVKKTMQTLIDQLGTNVVSSSEFSEKIGRYTDQISNASDIGALNEVLDKLMQATRESQRDATQSRDDMQRAQRELQEAETRVKKIEGQLSQMSAHVNQDPLTGSLNRRGLNDMLVREIARADRRNLPICFALLMLDDLPPGAVTRDAGVNDQALIHFVRVAGETLRTMDIVGRLDGKEFLLVLPDTNLGNASMVLTRLQRVLMERFFMHDEASLLLTFCAGVILRAPGEEPQASMTRAAAALALAKKGGKSRLVLGQPATG